MKLTWPAGVPVCLQWWERGEQDSRNNRLRPEKIPFKRFRTRVQLPPSPPNGMPTVNWTVLFGLSFTVGILLSRCQLIKRFFCLVRRQKSQPLMGPIVVIELNVVLYCSTELFLCFIIIPTKVFFLNGSKKGFGNSIVLRCSRKKSTLKSVLFFFGRWVWCVRTWFYILLICLIITHSRGCCKAWDEFFA